MPALSKFWVAQNNINDSCTMDRRVWIHWSSNSLYSWLNLLSSRFIRGHQREAADSLTVQTEVLGERLRKGHSVPFLGKKSKRVGILLKVTTCKALIGTIKHTEMLLSLYNFKNFFPVILRWITSSWVVSANVKSNDWLIVCFIQIFEHTDQVKALVFSIVVSVVLPLESSSCGNTSMGRPGRVWSIDNWVFLWIPFLHEIKTNSKRTGTWKWLNGNNSVVFHSLAVSSISKLKTFLSIWWDSINTWVLMIHSSFHDDSLSLLNAIEDEWFALISSVGTHTKKTFPWIGILLESVIKTKDGVWRSIVNLCPEWEGSGLLSNDGGVSHHVWSG